MKKIIVLNGSPKGDLSVTLQYIRFLQKKFPTHDYQFINVAQQIKKLEKDQISFDALIQDINSSDVVIWAFPLYFLLVHANYKRFIELVHERKVESFFHGKYTIAVSTSIHFYDHTAHNYIHGICDDLDMRYLGFYSAGMSDLLNEKKRKKFGEFGNICFEAIEKQFPTTKCYPPINLSQFEYRPSKNSTGDKVPLHGKKMLIISDIEPTAPPSSNLANMIQQFKASFTEPIEEINLWDLKINGSCLGCIQCGYDNHCAYAGTDDFIEFYETKVKPADILIYAGTIKDRYLSSRWKMYFDRSFYNTHIPVLRGKQIGFIISGPFSQIPNLREIFQGWIETTKSNTVDFITDESQDAGTIDGLLSMLAKKSVKYANVDFVSEATMLGVGGSKIFRDDIWGGLRFPFRADYKYYKKHGFFDFPQRRRKSIFLSNLMLFLSRSKGFRKEVNKRMKSQMVQPLQNVVENA
ncbi:MAG: NAD(P)H-dependent oxidoreductase [Promethearchaeota archaeon]